MTSPDVRARAKAKGMCTACQRRKIAVGRSRVKCAFCLDVDNAAHKGKRAGTRECVACGGKGHYQRACPNRGVTAE